MSSHVEVYVESIRQSKQDDVVVVLLKEFSGPWYLPIAIEKRYGDQLILALKGKHSEPPGVYDLLNRIVHLGGLEIEQVLISSLENDVFHAKMLIKRTGFFGTRDEIDCLPADALNVAARTKTSIFVAAKVMEQAGIRPDESQATTTTPDSATKESKPPDLNE